MKLNVKVSIIIPYLQERLDHIQDTMESLLAATDLALLEEIMYLDDANPKETRFHREILRFNNDKRVLKYNKRFGIEPL